MSAIVILSWIFLGLGVLSFFIAWVDISMGRTQKMGIMNIAWPITALYSHLLGLFIYFKYARTRKKKTHHKKDSKWVSVLLSATHCGAGCALADIVGEIIIYWAHITIWGHKLWASFIINFGLALLFGFLFQFWSIRPMHPRTSFGKVLINTVKADFFSLTSFQIGMYAWLLASHFIFGSSFQANHPLYWFMMQIGLVLGLLTSYPVNAWLISKKIKHPCM